MKVDNAKELGDAAAALTEQSIDVLRVGYSDIIGTERSRDVLVDRLPRTLSSGVAFCRSVYGTNPQGGEVDIKGGRVDGLPDMVAVPDLSSVRNLPWEPGVAHCVADLFNPDGTPAQESPRQVLRNVVNQFASLGMNPVVGPELEFYLLDRVRTTATGWARYGDAQGQHLRLGSEG